MKVLLIASAAYVTSELGAEFGDLPPAFLPVGGQRLFAHQAHALAADYDLTVLSLPESFELDVADAAALDALGLQIRRTPDRLSFKTSLDLVLEDQNWTQLDILYGDTLVAIPPMAQGQTDWLMLGYTDNHYTWHDVDQQAGARKLVWCGMFSFGSVKDLRECLALAENFDNAVNLYGERKDLSRPVCDDWLDFGHIHTFYVSKRIITTERHFNHLQISKNIVTKKSQHLSKMAAESRWFEDLPDHLRPFTPNYCGAVREADGQATGYRTEYLGLPTLSELFTFGRLPAYSWSPIFESIHEFIQACIDSPTEATTSPKQSLFDANLYRDKTLARTDEYCRTTHFDPNRAFRLNGISMPSMARILDEAASHIERQAPVFSPLVHGDLCFSNVLYDFRMSRIKVIDPRGATATGRLSGDLRYDIAKLTHSAIGYYDLILAKRYELKGDQYDAELNFHCQQQAPIAELLLETRLLGKPVRDWDCHPVMVLLFLSMLPLHSDRPGRQQAMLANAFRIYKDWTT